MVPYVGPYSPAVYNAANIIQSGGTGTPYTAPILKTARQVAGPGGDVLGDSTGPSGGGAAPTNPDDIAFLGDQAAQLRSLLGRTDTALSQGLTSNQDQYNQALGNATTQKDQQVQGQNQAKLSAYNTINQNAGNAYRSLAQIIGRAAGTGSSAFQDLLPNVIGKDTSSKRQAATDTYGQNLSNIDTSFNSTLADLLQQKKANEERLRSGIESQRQNIEGELATNAGQAAQAKGGGYAAVKAAQSPFQRQIENSRNAVESFFNQFRTPYTAQAQNPNLAAYTTDRTAINAGNQGQDTSDPYAAILRKRILGTA
jgi:hypothetical protein